MAPVEDLKQAATGFAQVGLYLRTEQWRSAEALNLTPTQLNLLVYLKRRGPNKGVSLARLLGISQATASRAIATLLRKGLVERQTDPGDGRASRVGLTPAGARLAADQPVAPTALLASLAGLDIHAHSLLQRTLTQIILGLQTARAIEPQRMCATCCFFRPYAHPDTTTPHHCDFVDAPFGTKSLRLDCGDHRTADCRTRQWRRFLAGPPKQRSTDPCPDSNEGSTTTKPS